IRDGFEVGIHGYDHVRWQDHLERLGDREIGAEIDQACEVYRAITGVESTRSWALTSSMRLDRWRAFIWIACATTPSMSTRFMPKPRAWVSSKPSVHWSERSRIGEHVLSGLPMSLRNSKSMNSLPRQLCGRLCQVALAGSPRRPLKRSRADYGCRALSC